MNKFVFCVMNKFLFFVCHYQTFLPRKIWVFGLGVIPNFHLILKKLKNCYTQTQNLNPKPKTKIFWVQTSVSHYKKKL